VTGRSSLRAFFERVILSIITIDGMAAPVVAFGPNFLLGEVMLCSAFAGLVLWAIWTW